MPYCLFMYIVDYLIVFLQLVATVHFKQYTYKRKLRLIRFKWLNLIKQVNRKLINGINWKTPKYEEIIGRRISPLHAGNTFCCIYVHLYISYANLFLCFYNMIWDIIFRTTFKVIWYRAWSNWARTHYIWIDCWYLARVLWDPGTLYSARTTIQGVDWCSACSVPTLVTTRARTRIQFSLSCKNCNSPQRSVNQTNLSWTLFWVFSLLWCCLETLFWTIRTATLSC